MLARTYQHLLEEHFLENRQMAFVEGPRQVGKTTICKEIGDFYLNWDNEEHQEIILGGASRVADYAGLTKQQQCQPILVLDELHKYSRWKNFLKGLFDTYEDRVRILVTGSSKMDVYRRGEDSLMGRYFLYHMHPISVGELSQCYSNQDLYSAPNPTTPDQWEALLTFGGFPEPFARSNERFLGRWHKLRHQQLFREDARELTRIQELQQLEALGRVLANSSGEQIVYLRLARQIRVSEKTIRSWIDTFEELQYGFLVRPWHRNLSRALRKEPKWYLRDWSPIQNIGQKHETLVACHLYKAVQFWTDLGLGNFSLHYLRDKEQREVDFLVVREEEPWFLVEVKTSTETLSPALSHYQKLLNCQHAFQVTLNEPYVEGNCFDHSSPILVSAKTFLSQLP